MDFKRQSLDKRTVIAHDICHSRTFKADRFELGAGNFLALEHHHGEQITNVIRDGDNLFIVFEDGSVIESRYRYQTKKGIKYYKWFPRIKLNTRMAKKPKSESLFTDETAEIVIGGTDINKPAATTEEIIEPSPTPKLKPVSTESLERIRGWQSQIVKEVDNLKVDLAKKLNDATEIFKALTELGQKDILQDPQFHEYVTVLGINQPLEEVRVVSSKPRPASKGSKRGRSSDVPAKILDYVQKKDGESVNAKEIEEKLGVAYLTANNNLKRMVKDGQLKEAGKDGRTILYALKK